MKRTVLALTFVSIAACAPSQDSSFAGSELYANYCSACHGLVGEGDGPVAAVMQTNVPNLRTLSERSGGTFPRDAVRAYVDGRNLPVSHGDRQMPIWGNVFQWDEETSTESESISVQRINAVVEFVETLQYE